MVARSLWGWAWVCAAALVSAMPAAAQAKDEKKESPAPPFWGKVTAEKVNIRMAPGTQGTIIRMAKEGESLLVVGKEDVWYQVAAPENAWCWVRTAAIKKTPEGEASAKQDTALRADSRLNAPEMGKLAKGAPVKILAEQGEWTKVQAPKSVGVYVRDKYVEFERAYDPKADGEIEVTAKPGAAAPARPVDAAPPPPKTEDVKKEVEALKRKYDEIDKRYREEIAKPPTPPPAPDKPDAEGWLDTVGLYFNRPGTHKLVSSEKKVICFLKSADPAKIKLDAFSNQYVGVRGKSEAAAGLEPLRVITVESVQPIAPQ